MLWEGFLEINPSFKVGRNENVLSFGLSGKSISIEVTAGHEHKLTAKQALFS
jgi:hypothetical protein